MENNTNNRNNKGNIENTKHAKYMPLKRTVICLLIAVLCFSVATHVCQSKEIHGQWNYTVKMDGFKNLKHNSLDLMFFGSSHTYCTFMPSVMSKYGIKSYVLATEQQTADMSYYYMREALKTQKPKVIVYETFMIGDFIPPDQTMYTALNPLPPSINKIEMTHAIIGKRKLIHELPFYFTIFKYYNRINDLTYDDFFYNPFTAHDPYSGYVYLTDSKPVERVEIKHPNKTAKLSKRDKTYLDKIVKLCEDNDIKLVLAYAPYMVSDNEIDDLNAVKEYAKEKHIPFFDGYDRFDSFDFDLDSDFLDIGHLNFRGAAKVTNEFARYIKGKNFL